MIISHSPPAKPAQTSTTSRPIPSEPPRDQRFAAFLRSPPTAAGLPNDTAPAYNQSDDQAHATSFESMPLIAPVSIDLADGDAIWTTGGAHPDRADVLGPEEPDAAVNRINAGSGEMRPPVAVPGISLDGSAAPTVPRRGATSAAPPPVAVIGTRSARSPAQPTAPFERADAPRPVIRSAPSRAAGEPMAFALSASVSVHVHSDGAQPRVAVRGLKVEAADRGEIAGRIAKLMRAHGYDISERMIDFEGAGQ